ncbi:MAG: hypothetical protein QM709_00430 [Spongiibacteraceae bacterium]
MAQRILVGTRKGLFVLRKKSHKPSVQWEIEGVHFLGEPVSQVLHDTRDNTLHVALNLGHFGVKMRRSRNDGKTWEETAVPAYPEQPSVSSDELVSADAKDAKDEKPWALNQVWSLETGGADQRNHLWAGTNPGGLFLSRDGGDSWELVRSLWDKPERKQWFGGGYDSPGIHSICVDPRNSQHVTIAISCGGIWQTRDGGNHWSVHCKGMFADYMPEERREDPIIQDPHRLVQNRANPDVMWVQHHCGIYYSNDNAASWQRIQVQPSSFGFAVATHPKNDKVAWFAPAIKDALRIPVDGKFVVTKTRDGGAQFDVIDNGLPQQAAYDLVYRHGLDVDDSGDQLVMGSTTGSLWLSKDSGESWQHFSAHLPPIYCVRFA